MARSNFGYLFATYSECLQFGMPILAMLSVSVHMPYKSIEAYEEESEDI